MSDKLSTTSNLAIFKSPDARDPAARANTIQGALLALSLVALLMVLLSGFLSYKHALHIVDNSQRVAHSHEVLAELTTIGAQISDAEAFQRGYVIMHIDLLYPYQESLRKIESQINKLGQLTHEDQVQYSGVQKLSELTRQHVEFAEKIIMARQENRINDALEEIEAGRGSAFTSKMNKIIEEMKLYESSRLRSGTDSLNDSSRQMIVTIVFLGVLSLSSLIMLLFAGNMYLTERKRAENLSALQYDIARLLAGSGDIPSTIQSVINSTAVRLDWDAGVFWAFDEKSQTLSCMTLWHKDTIPESKLLSDSQKRTFTSDMGRVGAALHTNKPLWIPDVVSDPLFSRKELATDDGIRTAYYVPVFTEEASFGVFEFLNQSPREPDHRVFDTFESISRQLAQFIHRKRFEWALLVSEARLNSILSNMAEAVIVADLTGVIIQTNLAAERMFGEGLTGRRLDQWIEQCGIHDQTLVPVHSLDALPITRAINEEAVNEEELFIRNDVADNGIWVSATARPVKDETGKLLGGVMVLRDISERKEAEQRVSEFYSMVSHELRTPLTSIRASLGLMQGGVAGDLSDMALELIDIGREECDRLIRLINNILDIRKIEAGRFDLVRNEVEAKDLVRSAVDGLKGFAEAHNVALQTNGLVDEALVCDADRIIQVLTNLISNAIKFSPENSVVTVSTETIRDEAIRFSVTDNGAGIAPEKIKKLFHKFQQLDQSTTRKVGGTGLGLAISKAIIRQHGGVINVVSTPGQGSTFFFEIPFDLPEQEKSS